LSQVELYEAVMERSDAAGMANQRAALARGLTGDVLEIGAGTGAMFEHYAPDVKLVAIEPAADFLAAARAKVARARCRVELVAASAEAMPFGDRTFDAAVLALVLCSVADVGRVLAEVARVLRPGAPVRLIEHVRSPRPVAGALM